jgi:CelD/BcsL family acetyltransferase involved in cellulose biosynthesis
MSPAVFRVELVTRRSEIPLDSEQWNALVAANETNTVFQTYEWFDAWWEAMGEGRELFFIVIREGDAVCGFAPLTRRRSQFGWRLLEFAGTGNADYQDFILPRDKPRQLAAVCEFLRSRRFSWERLALSNVPSHSSTHTQLLAAAASTGLSLVDEVKVLCPTLLLMPDPTPARRMIEKYSLRRPLNWFRKHGEVNFRHVTSRDEIEKLLPTFFDQHRRRWANVGKPSLFSDARQTRFFELLARGMHAHGWLQFSIVEFNGEPIACHFGFDYCGCVTWYKPSFETRFAGHSPGLLLTRQLIEDGLRRSRRELDFTIGDEAFKERFSSHQRRNLYFGVYPSHVSGTLAAALLKLRRSAGRLKRRLRAARARRAEQPEPLPCEAGRGSA